MKMAIVPYQSEFVGLVCAEMPEARFEDIQKVELKGRRFTSVDIDPVFLDVCEPGSIVVSSAVPSHIAVVAARLEGNKLTVEVDRDVPYVTVRLTGVRKGHTSRFARFSQTEAESNTRFWNGWRRG